eukprot:Nitzschia sp. Nitz4//scaffold14_size191712//3203//4546//NITZ4_001697-RA/size191712-processed-gene-0.256-mRNA-1//1//CDS//3329536849//3588//frame0
MSAYALPGLFPPIESSSDNYETGFSDTTSYFGQVAEPCESSYSTNDLVPSPLHHQIDGSRLSGIVTASLDLLSVPSFTSRRNGIEEDKQVYLDTEGTFFAKQESKAPACVETSSLNSDDHGIAVKEAKIDPVRLIHSLTGWPRASSNKQGASQHQHSQRKTLRKRGSRERLSDVASPQSSPGTWKSTTTSPKECFPSAPGMKAEPQNEEDADDRHADSTSSVSTPHDEAIEFELAIAFNGRKYTATRTLQRIVQLRDDLIREMNNRKRWLRIRRSSAAVAKATTNSTCSSMEEEEEYFEHDAPTVEGTLDESQKEGDDVDDITIPEIPAIITCDGGTGAEGASFMGRGFTMIQAMAKSYVPLVERWLRNIMVIVPQDSECLTNFLWEPISTSEFPGLDAVVEPYTAGTRSSNNLAALGSIKELDYNTGDDDSDLEPDEDGSQAPADW